MAIDNARDRASIVAISLYSMGGSKFQPSVIGEAQNRRQAQGYGYYGIQVGAPPAPDEIAPQSIRIGAYGLLGGKGKTPIGRGF